MAARTGMANLITRLRALTNAGTADYAISSETYWSDSHLQDILDGNALLVEGAALAWLPDVSGGVPVYHRAKAPYRDLEAAESGTIYWRITDSLGNVQGTAGYTPDYIRGEVRFAANQAGTAYYLTGRSYDLHSAAADVWNRRAAYYADWYSFSSDQQRFDRQQAWEHATKMENVLRAKAGQNVQRGELRANAFVRRDLNPTAR